MPEALIECVPNFCEGRDREKFRVIVDAAASVAGVRVLAWESDGDHNRSVLTFAGRPEAVLEAAFQTVARAVELIDLTRQSGEHPRIGAADVVPLVPLRHITLEQCAAHAHALGKRIWAELRVPVYFYEAAARREDRRKLENIRRGQFEGLREEVKTNPERRPDIGGPELHPTAGATVVGARKVLIAYNINLDTADVAIAKKIAKTVRASSGGLPHVKAVGLMLHSRNQAQVSMNLTDFEHTPVHVVYEAVRREAERLGVRAVGSEMIGLWPRAAMEAAAAHFLRLENYRQGGLLDDLLDDAQV